MGPLGSIVAGFLAVLQLSVKALDEDYQIAERDKSWAVPNSVNCLDYKTWAETHQNHVGDFMSSILAARSTGHGLLKPQRGTKMYALGASLRKAQREEELRLTGTCYPS